MNSLTFEKTIKRTIVLMMVVLFINLGASATNYYSKSTGNLEILSNWGTNTDGTGTAPADFTSSGNTFNIRNNATPTIGADWTVSGVGSKIVVGDGTNACNFTIPGGFTVSSAGDVSNAGIVTVSVNGILIITGSSTTDIGGTLIVNGEVRISDNPTLSKSGTITYNSGSVLRYVGAVARDIGPELPTTIISGLTVFFSNGAGFGTYSSDMIINGTVEVEKDMNFGNGKGVIVQNGGVLRVHGNQMSNNSANSYLTVEAGGTVETENSTGLINAANSGGKSFIGFNALSLASTSTITYNRSGSQNIDADAALVSSQKYGKLIIAGSGTKSLTGVTTVLHTLDLMNNTTLSTGDNLVIPSGARVDQLDGTISGEMMVETALTANRKYRFLCSPVVGGTGLEWRDNAGNTSGRGIQITGTAGSGGNFDVSTSNANSAFSYIEANGNTETSISNTATDNAGWAAWTDGNQSLTNGVGYRVYVRGDRSISLTGGSATPNATTIWVKGTNPSTAGVSVSVSQATQSSTSKGWNLIGNPYPSNWASQVSAGADNSFYVYGIGSNSYQTLSFGTSIVMPAQAFLIHLQNAGTQNFTFSESQKTAASASGNYFKKAAKDELSFRFQYDSLNYSDGKVGIKTDATGFFDPQFDAYGLINPIVNLATYDEHGTMYNWNYMPEFNATRVVPMTLKGSPAGSYTITFSGLNTFENTKIFLKDYYLNSSTELSNNFTYHLAIDTNQNSGGNNRLELIFQKTATGLNSGNDLNHNFQLFPNPASEIINIALNTNQGGQYSYGIYNGLGQEMNSGIYDFAGRGNLCLNISSLPAGVYFVKIFNGNCSETLRFIK